MHIKFLRKYISICLVLVLFLPVSAFTLNMQLPPIDLGGNTNYDSQRISLIANKFDKNNLPIIAFADPDHSTTSCPTSGTSVSVIAVEENGYYFIGKCLPGGGNPYSIKLKQAENGDLYLGYSDNYTSKVTVLKLALADLMKNEEYHWVPVGNNSTLPQQTGYIDLELNLDGIPYLAWENKKSGNAENSVSLKIYNPVTSVWEDNGINFASWVRGPIHLEVNSKGQPYVATLDWDYFPKVYAYTKTTNTQSGWEFITSSIPKQDYPVAGDSQFDFELYQDVPYFTFQKVYLMGSLLSVCTNGQTDITRSSNSWHCDQTTGELPQGNQSFDKHPIFGYGYDGLYLGYLGANYTFYINPMDTMNDLGPIEFTSTPNFGFDRSELRLTMANCGKCNTNGNGPRFYTIVKQNNGYAVQSN